MKQRLAVAAFALYAAAQLFASFPSEFVPKALLRVHAAVHAGLREVGLSPGLAVFNGNLPPRVPKEMCVVAVAEDPEGARPLYVTESCRPPTVRVVEKTFDGYLSFQLVNLAYYRESGTDTELLVAAAKMFCSSTLFSDGKTDRVALAARSRTRDYATNVVHEDLLWPFFWNCRSGKREDARPTDAMKQVLTEALAEVPEP